MGSCTFHFTCVLFWLTIILTFHSAFDLQEKPCVCDYSNIAGNCVCVESNVTSLRELFELDRNLCFSDAPIHSAEFINLQHLRSISDNSEFQSTSNCSWEYLTNMSLSGTTIGMLDATSFTDFPNLVWLNFSNHPQLNNYGDMAFAPLGNRLTTLIARHNPVRSLTRDVFGGLHALQRLILSDNKIGYIEAGVFSRNCCNDLRELRLDNNILTVLDSDTLLGLTRLEVLDLRNNPLQQLDPGCFIHAAATLTELYMSHSDPTPFGGFDSPHPDLFVQLNRLTALQMDELKVKNLTAANFRGLNNLRTLSLRGNRLIQLPSDVFSSLKQLEHLDLSANWLVCIGSSLNPTDRSDFLSGLPLKWIDLSWNRLTHLSHLTSRSLGLFEPAPIDGTRLVLNLTANPWQHIDDDTFCGPPAAPVIRPTDLIVGPVPSTPFGAWRTSLGLWFARATWPNGSLALIGPSSRIFGLMLADPSTVRLQKLLEEESGLIKFGYALSGANDSQQQCQQFRTNKRSRRTSNQSDIMSFELREIKRPSAISIAYSLSSYCPRLPIHKLEDWELTYLKVSELIDSYDALSKSPLGAIERGSRLYLLVIVGVCITFLLIALTVIMCYRAWSRRTSQKCVGHDYEGGPTALTLEGPTEKHLLLHHQAMPNSNHHNNINNHDHMASVDRQSSLSQSEPPNGMVNNASGLRSISPNLGETPSVADAVSVIRTHHRSGRPKSDSDANEIDASHKLTAFGVV